MGSNPTRAAVASCGFRHKSLLGSVADALAREASRFARALGFVAICAQTLELSAELCNRLPYYL